MMSTYQFLVTFVRERLGAGPGQERGASLVEYALLIALIAIVCFVAVQFLGETTSKGYSSAASSLN